MSKSALKQAQEVVKKAKQLAQQLKRERSKELFDAACIKRFGRLLKKGDVLVTNLYHEGVKIVRVRSIDYTTSIGTYEINCDQQCPDGTWVNGWKACRKFGFNPDFAMSRSVFVPFKVRFLSPNDKFEFRVTVDQFRNFKNKTTTTHMFSTYRSASKFMRKICREWDGKCDYSHHGYINLYDHNGDYKGKHGSIERVMVLK